MTDAKGAVYEHIEYLPFGETWVEEQHKDNSDTPYKFTGKELDTVTGLYYYGARYYDPRTSVWQSPDPILEQYMGGGKIGQGVFNPQNLSLFTYTYNNPINLTDPDGNIPALAFLFAPEAASIVMSGIAVVGAMASAVYNNAKESIASALVDMMIGGDDTSSNPFGPNGEVSDNHATSPSSVPTPSIDDGLESKKEEGSYTNTHESGKVYVGKGSQERSQVSGRREEAKSGDPHIATDWTKSPDERSAFKDESIRLDEAGGVESENTYNRIESPGKNYRIQDGEL